MKDVFKLVRRMGRCLFFSILAFSWTPLFAAPPVSLVVHAGKPAHAMSKNLYGVFFEDINYAADGGLYAEMIQNRSFEFMDSNTLFGWTMVRKGTPLGNMFIETERPLNTNNPHFLRMQISDCGDGVGIRNDGFGNMVIGKGSNYVFSIYARVLDGKDGILVARLENEKDESLGQMAMAGIAPNWNHFPGTIKATGSSTNAHLVIYFQTPGTVDIDMVSLFPENTFKQRPNGMRADLAQMVADLKPSFVRFPGGCIVEGKDLANRYRWKDTIGDVAERRGNWNRWQSAMPEAPAPHYFQSYGLGFYEFFQFCEDIGAEPLPVLNCGMSCQFQDAQLVPTDELDPYIQDALDLIEFANGPETSYWGGKRSEMGHPEPFHMKMLAIGNEQWGDSYFERYDRFTTVLKKQHPEIEIIASAGPNPDGNFFDSAWAHMRTAKADFVDEHYYRVPSWFINHADRYDRYDRNGPKVFAGEYAAHTPDRKNSLEAALAEAAFMTGIERNSDLVAMASYAPLFARKGSVQWPVDLIWFDDSRVYGTPEYQVQKLFSLHRGEQVLATDISDKRLPSSACGGICLTTYHTEAEFKDVRVTRGTKELFEGRFEKQADGWTTDAGTWTVKDGRYHQSDVTSVATSSAGSAEWTDYTVTLKARKIGGDEGFIIGVRHLGGGSKIQWNLGGWGNKQHGIQDLSGGNDRIVERVPGTIESDRWYTIKIELKGTRMSCYLDGALIQSADIPVHPTQRFFATASRDPKKDLIIIKAVNPTGEGTTARITLEGLQQIRSTGKAIVLTSKNPGDENSFLEPLKIGPKTEEVSGFKPSFRYHFKPYSLTILQIEAER